MRGFAIRAHRDCPYQHFWYTHFGESLISQSSYSGQYSSPYRFNGKELDGETGLYYYGARYYDPKISIWLSVDQRAHWYLGTSPYAYVLNNPINLIDPTGMSSESPDGGLGGVKTFFQKVGNWLKGNGWVENYTPTPTADEALENGHTNMEEIVVIAPKAPETGGGYNWTTKEKGLMGQHQEER